MNIDAERNQIIEQINHVDDINVLKAIKNLLMFASAKEKVFDLIISDEQKEMVRSRVKKYETDPNNVLSWNEVEAKLKKS
jgi:hypothetical protein